jgi:hypothetical protein
MANQFAEAVAAPLLVVAGCEKKPGSQANK